VARAVLHVFEMRSQGRLNGGGTRPVLRVWARWVPDLEAASGFADRVLLREGSPEKCHAAYFLEARSTLRKFTAGAVGACVYVRAPLHAQIHIIGITCGAAKFEIAAWHCGCVVLLHRHCTDGMWAVACLPTWLYLGMYKGYSTPTHA
jgi:hypothetical protein